MKLGHSVLKIKHQKAHSLSDRRDTEPVPIRYGISYSREEGARIVTGARALKELSGFWRGVLDVALSSIG